MLRDTNFTLPAFSVQVPESTEPQTPSSDVTHVSDEHLELSAITSYSQGTASEWSEDEVTGQSLPLMEVEEEHVVVCRECGRQGQGPCPSP